MRTRSILSLGLSALVLGGTMVGCASQGSLAVAAGKAQDRSAKEAAKQAEGAREAIAKRKADKAVKFAEAAVSLDPQNSEHRALLGQAYLLAGRFVSAKDALTDALTLDPGNGRVALNLALSQIALGDWETARQTLAGHADSIPVGDRGLALALAGDPAGGVAILGEAVRAPEANAKTRQNLALALALAGRWGEAQAVAAIDVSPAEVDKRILQWASFARPANAYDQVAALLRVTPVEDAGQPVALALAQSASTQVAAVSTVDPIDAYMPAAAEEAPQIAAEMGQAVAASDPAELAQPAAPAASGVVFGPRQEIVQAIPIVAERAVAQAAPRKPSGSYVVQLGAYRDTGAARAAWYNVSQRVSSLSGHAPSGMKVKTAKGVFHRLSVNGFSRAEATELCGQVKASGGNCFVRAAAGDAVASWAKGPQVASR